MGLVQHAQAMHQPMVQCSCGGEYRIADRYKHFRESSAHPSCFVCGEGFAKDPDLDQVSISSCFHHCFRPCLAWCSQHLSSAQLDSRCRLCTRQFRTSDELVNHYRVSSAHPHCALCEVGFADEDTCDEVCFDVVFAHLECTLNISNSIWRPTTLGLPQGFHLPHPHPWSPCRPRQPCLLRILCVLSRRARYMCVADALLEDPCCIRRNPVHGPVRAFVATLPA